MLIIAAEDIAKCLLGQKIARPSCDVEAISVLECRICKTATILEREADIAKIAVGKCEEQELFRHHLIIAYGHLTEYATAADVRQAKALSTARICNV